MSRGTSKIKKRNINIEEIKDKVSRYFSTRPEIKIGYIFGSRAKGKKNKLSDIDIAILTDEEKVPKDVPYGYKAKVIADLMSILKTGKVDLVILNESPLFLCFRVIHDSLILYSQDEKKRIDFEVKIMSRYLDRKFYYDRHINLSLAAIAREGIL
jgi:hypothetical protein